MRGAIERADASFFESITAIAACAFRDAGVDVAVYEVGLGGRLDSTNALPATTSVITGIGHDHEAILGRGLQAICAEKLGIARPGVPLFASLHRDELVEQARQHCKRVEAPFHLVPDGATRIHEMRLDAGTRFDLLLDEEYDSLWTRFFGAHQVRNAATATAAAGELLRLRFPKHKLDVRTAVARAFLPGRFQVLPPRHGEPMLVLDVAHNPESLCATLDIAAQVLASPRPTVVLGMLRDKKLTGVVERLRRVAARLVLTQPRVARAWDAHQVAADLRAQLGHVAVSVEPQAEAAVAQVCDAGETALVLGSHYLIGELLPGLARRRGTTAEALVHGSHGVADFRAAG